MNSTSLRFLLATIFQARETVSQQYETELEGLVQTEKRCGNLALKGEPLSRVSSQKEVRAIPNNRFKHATLLTANALKY